MHGVADRLRLVRRDAAVIAGQQHRPFGQGYEQRVEHFELHRNVPAVQRHRVDIRFELPQHLVVLRVFKGGGLEICRQADMKDVRRLFRRTEGLRIGRTQRHQPRLKPLPYQRIGIGLLQVHIRQRWDALEIGQRRHVHDRKTRQFRLGDLDHQNADRMVGVLRLLHRKADQIVARKVDLGGRGRVQLARQIAREDRTMHRLVAQLDANFGAVAVDEVGRLLPANQGHVVPRHQKLCRQQGAIGGSKDQNVARHTLSFTGDAGIVSDAHAPGGAEISSVAYNEFIGATIT